MFSKEKCWWWCCIHIIRWKWDQGGRDCSEDDKLICFSSPRCRPSLDTQSFSWWWWRWRWWWQCLQSSIYFFTMNAGVAQKHDYSEIATQPISLKPPSSQSGVSWKAGKSGESCESGKTGELEQVPVRDLMAGCRWIFPALNRAWGEQSMYRQALLWKCISCLHNIFCVFGILKNADQTFITFG